MMSVGRLLVSVAVLAQLTIYLNINANYSIATQARASTSAPSISTTEKRHPFLYYTSREISRLRDQVGGTHKALYERLSHIVHILKNSTRKGKLGKLPPVAWREFGAKWNEAYGNNLGTLAMYCALTPQDYIAHNLTMVFMRRLAGYPSWFVKGKENDVVPLAHSMLGFATAFDLLYDSFTEAERAQYLAKLYAAGRLFYVRSFEQHSWGGNFIHNHVPTNYVALLACAITIKPYYPQESIEWSDRATSALDKTMRFLKMVVDGSLNEGVSYGTYTMRSLMRFIYFAQRHHMNLSYPNHNWLKEHFHFLLHSLLPGYQRTFGIADSVQDWAYSPEPVLMFLEDYAILNGTSVWLASQISKHRTVKRKKQMLNNAHFSIILEFLFYNTSIRATPVKQLKLHVFSDLGILTYGGGMPDGEVYLSFKCGRLHGRSINMIRPKLNVVFQQGFKPGHEQPDHGSFVFVTKEQAVITDGFYAPKFTFLENSLMFGTCRKSSTSSSQWVAWSGQLGEGEIWLQSHSKAPWLARGEIVGYSTHGRDIVFMSGDMTSWYHGDLGLSKVYRVLVMLTPSVLVVVDTVHLKESSSTKYVSSFFHNVDVPFKIREPRGRSPPRCASISLYSMCWAHHNSHTVHASAVNNFRMKRARFATNMINITWQLLASAASTAYVFHGPRDSLHDVKLTAWPDGIKVRLLLNATRYDIMLATNHGDVRARRALLGSSGYGKLHINHTMAIDLGVSGGIRHVNYSLAENIFIFRGDEQAFFYAPLASVLVLVCLCVESMKGKILSRYIRLTMFLFFFFTFGALLFYLRGNTIVFGLKSFLTTNLQTRNTNRRHVDAVLVTGLPLSGSALTRELFTTNTDFVVVGVPSEDIVPPSTRGLFKNNLTFGEWGSNPDNRVIAKWWKKLIKTPTLVKKNGQVEHVTLNDPIYPHKRYYINVTKPREALPMVHLSNPGWLLQVGQLDSVLPRDCLAPMLYLVRDPRSWIEHLLSQTKLVKLFLRDLKNALRQKEGIKVPTALASLWDIYKPNMPEHVILAHVWRAFVSHALDLETSLAPNRFKIVRFEDLVKSPKESARKIFRYLRMPFPAAVEHRILLVAKSGVVSLRYYGIVSEKLTSWGRFLTKPEIFEIEKICRKTMKKVGYHR